MYWKWENAKECEREQVIEIETEKTGIKFKSIKMWKNSHLIFGIPSPKFKIKLDFSADRCYFNAINRVLK